MISVQRTDITIYGNVFGGGSCFPGKQPETTCSQMQKVGGSGNMKLLKNSITGNDSHWE